MITAVKGLFKKNIFFRKSYYGLVYGALKLVPLLVKISPAVASKYVFTIITRKKMNLKNPQDFNEKLQWLKLNWQHPLVVKCADKFEVRDFVRERGCQEILNQLYGIYNNTSEIDWDLLPAKFTLKSTNGSGSNIICDNKNKLDKNEALTKMEKWMRIDYGLIYAEIHYSKLKPRIICEKYLQLKNRLLPSDFYIYCFNGKPRMINAITEKEGKYYHFYVDMEWKEMKVLKNQAINIIIPAKPSSFIQMVSYAEKLSKGFPFVRIDFYEYHEKPILGEMTFTPYGAMATCYSDEALNMLGSWIELPKKYIEQSSPVTLQNSSAL